MSKKIILSILSSLAISSFSLTAFSAVYITNDTQHDDYFWPTYSVYYKVEGNTENTYLYKSCHTDGGAAGKIFVKKGETKKIPSSIKCEGRDIKVITDVKFGYASSSSLLSCRYVMGLPTKSLRHAYIAQTGYAAGTNFVVQLWKGYKTPHCVLVGANTSF